MVTSMESIDFLKSSNWFFLNSNIMLVYFVLKLHQLNSADGIQNRIGNDDRSDQSFQERVKRIILNGDWKEQET